MKKCLALIAVSLALGCSTTSMDSVQNSAIVPADVQYGSSVVSLPAIPAAVALAKQAGGSAYTFQLTIAGPGMSQMTRSWQLGAAETSFVVDRIPAGEARVFTGYLIDPSGVITHEGADTVAIYAGKTAYVSLYLRKSGTAQVKVIIEGVNDTPVTTGCYQLMGVINGQALDGLTMKVLEQNDSILPAYILKGDEVIGKLFCRLYGTHLTGYISMGMAIPIDSKIEGDMTPDRSAFKAQAFDNTDTSKNTGYIGGVAIPCNPPPPPPATCPVDTMGGPTSCKDTATWISYAASACKQNGGILRNYWFMAPCSKSTYEIFYSYICYECCKQ
jgi:hypothetical protein